MNEQTAALLQNLADKLGTTSQYLWAVLVKQAPIYSVITLVEYVAFALLLTALYRFRVPVGKFIKAWFETEEITAFIFCVVAGLTLVTLILSCLFSVSPMLTGFLNPEYWALKEVMNAVKK